jgi:hypothetical protein
MADVIPELVERIEILEAKANLYDERFVLRSDTLAAQGNVDQSAAPATKLDLANATDSVVSPNVLPSEQIGAENPPATATVTAKKK